MAVKARASVDLASVSDGTGILKVTTAPTAYTTTTGGFKPSYRIALSTVAAQSSVEAVKAGDMVQYSYYQYKVGYVDGTYAYLAARTSIRGATGAAGSSVTAVKLQYALAESAEEAPDSGWQDSVPEWEAGKYIWQRPVTTIGASTTQTGDAALFGAFNSLAEGVAGNSSRISQTAESVKVQFDGVSGQLQKQAAAVDGLSSGLVSTDAKVENLKSWLQVDADGLTMGKSDSPYISKLDNSKLGFYAHSGEGDTELASFGADGMEIPNASIGRLAVEPYEITVRGGHLLVQYAG